MEKYLKSSTIPTIDITNVTLSFNETLTFPWIFSGLNVNVSQCRLHSIGIVVQIEKYSDHTAHLIGKHRLGKLEVTISNSSFRTLDLKPRTKAQITESHIDGEFKDRSTLITANNSDVSIQNCHFENFVNKNGSTILLGHNNSHVTIENSVFIQHNGSKGVLFLKNNSSMCVSSSTISQNVAFTLGYSAITLLHGINADVHNTVFNNNSALVGGFMLVVDQCQVTLKNCTFSSNKAITGKTLTLLKNRRTMFNQTWLKHKKTESIAEKTLDSSKSSTRRHLHQNNIRTFEPVVILPKATNKSTAQALDQNNSGTFTSTIPLLFNQTSSDAKKL